MSCGSHRFHANGGCAQAEALSAVGTERDQMLGCRGLVAEAARSCAESPAALPEKAQSSAAVAARTPSVRALTPQCTPSVPAQSGPTAVCTASAQLAPAAGVKRARVDAPDAPDDAELHHTLHVVRQALLPEYMCAVLVVLAPDVPVTAWLLKAFKGVNCKRLAFEGWVATEWRLSQQETRQYNSHIREAGCCA